MMKIWSFFLWYPTRSQWIPTFFPEYNLSAMFCTKNLQPVWNSLKRTKVTNWLSSFTRHWRSEKTRRLGCISSLCSTWFIGLYIVPSFLIRVLGCNNSKCILFTVPCEELMFSDVSFPSSFFYINTRDRLNVMYHHALALYWHTYTPRKKNINHTTVITRQWPSVMALW